VNDNSGVASGTASLLSLQTSGTCVVGNALASSDGGTGGNNTWSVGAEVAFDSLVTGLKMYIGDAGTLHLKRMRRNGNGGYDFIEQIALAVNASAINTFTQEQIEAAYGGPWAVAAGDQMMVGSVANVLTYRTLDAPVYFNTSGDVSTSAFFGWSGYNSVGAVNAQINAQITLSPLRVPVNGSKKGVQLEEVGGFGTSLPSGWSQSGDWAISGGHVASGTVGLSSQLIVGRSYGIDQRTLTWTVEATADDTIIGLTTNPAMPGEGAELQGSYIQLNFSTNRLEIGPEYLGGGTIGAMVDSHDPGFTLTKNVLYTVEWVKRGRDFTVTLSETGGFNSYSIDVTNNNYNYQTYSPQDITTKYGLMHGSPSVACIAGACNVHSWRHVANVLQDCTAMFIGDSITEGFTVAETERFAALVRADMADSRDVAITAVGGDTTKSCLLRLGNELGLIRPRNVVVFLGSNGEASTAAYEANLGVIIELAKAVGAKVFVCTVPANATYTTYINTLTGVTIVPFDKALTIGGAGTTPVADYFDGEDEASNTFNDGLHPNAVGHMRIYRLLRIAASDLWQ
jgi:lysophospholipase L1-like esterase